MVNRWQFLEGRYPHRALEVSTQSPGFLSHSYISTALFQKSLTFPSCFTPVCKVGEGANSGWVGRYLACTIPHHLDYRLSPWKALKGPTISALPYQSRAIYILMGWFSNLTVDLSFHLSLCHLAPLCFHGGLVAFFIKVDLSIVYNSSCHDHNIYFWHQTNSSGDLEESDFFHVSLEIVSGKCGFLNKLIT
jgi:hypothetical protein